jgi:sugar phosphate isomerase/epimerase
MNEYIFGFNVFNSPPENFIEYSVLNNLNHIEINLSKPHSSIESFDNGRIADLKKNNSNLQFSLHLPHKINIADNIFNLSRSNIKYLFKAIELASKLEAKYIICHMGFFFWFPVEKWQREKSLKRFVRNLDKILEICNQHNVIIALENVTPLPHGSEHLLLGDNVKDFEFVFKQFNSPLLKFCLDTGHANMAEGVDTYLERFSNRLVSVHYHDNNGNDDAHLPIGEGNINWNDFATKIKEIKFCGPFISECRNIKPSEATNYLKKYLE